MTQKTLTSRITRLFKTSTPRISSTTTRQRIVLVFTAAFTIIAMLNGNPQARADDHVYRVGDGVSAPKVLGKVEPEYTEEARAAHVEGSVVLSVVIGTDGVVHDVSIVRSLEPGLDRMAADSLQKWRFQPGQLKGEPVAIRASIEVNFKLK